jgi:site-specific recombinase XerD
MCASTTSVTPTLRGSSFAGGADLQVVKQCLGHGSLRTTEKYLHTLPDADETALEALSKMRNRV